MIIHIAVCVVATTVEPVMAQSLSPSQAKKVPSEDLVRVPMKVGIAWSNAGDGLVMEM